jgi:IS5 family transposase
MELQRLNGHAFPLTVEHPFRVIKCQFGHVKTRYRGLAKNRAQLFTLFALGNLFLVRRKLMA